MAAFPADQVAEYTGRLTDSQAKKQLDLWKRNERKLIVATMDKGGTGLSYHDTTGTMPERVQVNINLPWSGTQVEQVSGRLARLGTAKPVTLEWIFADNIPFERELSRTVGARMRAMQAAVQGIKSETARKIRDFDIDESPAAPVTFEAERVGKPGKNSVITFADGSKREIQYVAVEDDVIIPSHDARRNFAQNERGAKNLQRPYHDPVEGMPGREQVRKIAEADPDKLPLLVSDTPSPTDGPPVVTPDGNELVVRGGNARSMGTQLGYYEGGEKAARFKQTMVDAAEKFNIDRAAVEKMQRPIIVRVLVPVADESMARLEQLLNDPMTAGMTASSKAVSRGATLSQAAADEISMMLEPSREGQPAPSIREVLADSRKANKIKHLLVATGVVVQRDLDEMLVPGTGEFNEVGKLAVEELLLAKIVSDPVIVGKMTPAERRTLLASLGPITRLASHAEHGPRFSELLRVAAEAFPEYKASGVPLRQYFLEQTSIVEFAGQGDKMVAALVDSIDKLGIRGFKNMLTDVLVSLGIQKKQKGLFNEVVKPASNVDEALTNAITATLGTSVLSESEADYGRRPGGRNLRGEEAGPAEQPMIVTGTNIAQTLDTNVEREPKPISALDITKTWEKDFDVPIRAGRLSGTPAAVYKRLFGVIRAKEEHVGNLAVHAHEVAHHVDRTEKLLRSMPDDVKVEVRKLDYEPDREDETQATHEGFAEFIRHYLTENDAARVAPKTYRWWTEEWLPAHPRWQAPFERAHRMAHQYSEQGVYARLRAFVSGKLGRPLEQPALQTAKETTMNWFRRFYSKWKDQFWALHRYSQVAEDKGVDFDGKESPYELAMAFSLTAPAHAFRSVWEGPHTMTGTEQIVGPGLREALSTIRSDEEYDEAQFFAISRLVVELADKKPDYNPGVRLDDAEAWIAEVERDPDKFNRYTHFADSLREYHGGLVVMQVDAGMLTPDEARRIIESLDYYVPLVRVRPTGKEGAGGGRFFNLPQAVRRRSRSGSGRQIMDLIDATVQRTMRAYSLAMQQQVAKAIVETGDPRYGGARGMGAWIESVSPRRLLERFPLTAMLKPLVNEGVLTEDDARKIDLMSRIRFLEEEADEGEVGKWNGRQLNKENLEWLADQLGVEIEDREAEDIYPELIEAGSEIPNGLAMIGLWKMDFSPDPRTHIVRYRGPDGRPRMYEINEYLYDATMGMNPVMFGPFMRAVNEMSKAFKLGAVGLSTGFGVANIPRDWMANFQQAAEQGTLESTVSPFRWLAVYAASEFGLAEENEAVKIWSEYGGELMTRLGIDNEGLMTRLFGRRKGLRLRRQLQAQTIGDKIAVVAKHPFHTLLDLPSNIRNLISMSDVGPRIGEFVASLRRNGWVIRGGKFYNAKTGRGERPPRWAIVKAMNAASDVTTNFKRFGSIGRYVDAAWPFFNATLESMDKQFRTLGRLRNIADPGERGRLARKLIVTMSALAAASLVYWLKRRDDDDYEEREAWERLNYWTYPLSDELTIYAPKPFDWNVIPNLIEAGAEAYTSRNPDALAEFGFETAMQRLPRGGGLVRGGIEQAMDWDFYRNRPIEGEYMKYQPVELRSTKYTSELAKALSGLLSLEGTRYGLSPVRVEHLLNSTTGGATRRWEDTAKAMLEGKLEVRHLPGLRGVLKDYQGRQSVDDFYAAKADATMEYQSAKIKGPVPEDVYQHYRRMEDYEGMISELRAAIPDGASEEVAVQYERYILGLARDAIGKEELPSFPNPLKRRSLPAGVKKVVDGYIERLRQRRDASAENLQQGEKETATGFKRRVEVFKLRQGAAEETMNELGVSLPAKNPRGQFGRRRKGITFSFP